MGQYPLIPWLNSKTVMGNKKPCHPPDSNEEILVAVKDEKTQKF
jgi:hypothetical protein